MKKVFLIISLITFPLIAYADRNDYDHDRGDHGYHYWNKVDRRRDAKILQHKQRKIHKRIDRLRYQYRVSDYNRRKIMHELNETSENIYRLKHNNYYAHGKHYQHSRYYQPYAYEQNITHLSGDFVNFYIRY